jgi:PAS domain S-box-containing protein
MADVGSKSPDELRYEAVLILAINDEGLITDIGTSCEPLLGYECQELIGKPLKTLLAGDFSEIDAMAAHSKPTVQRVSMHIKTKAGAVFSVIYCCRRRTNGWSGFVAISSIKFIKNK